MDLIPQAGASLLLTSMGFGKLETKEILEQIHQSTGYKTEIPMIALVTSTLTILLTRQQVMEREISELRREICDLRFSREENK